MPHTGIALDVTHMNVTHTHTHINVTHTHTHMNDNSCKTYNTSLMFPHVHTLTPKKKRCGVSLLAAVVEEGDPETTIKLAQWLEPEVYSNFFFCVSICIYMYI